MFIDVVAPFTSPADCREFSFCYFYTFQKENSPLSNQNTTQRSVLTVFIATKHIVYYFGSLIQPDGAPYKATLFEKFQMITPKSMKRLSRILIHFLNYARIICA